VDQSVDGATHARSVSTSRITRARSLGRERFQGFSINQGRTEVYSCIFPRPRIENKSAYNWRSDLSLGFMDSCEAHVKSSSDLDYTITPQYLQRCIKKFFFSRKSSRKWKNPPPTISTPATAAAQQSSPTELEYPAMAAQTTTFAQIAPS